MTTNLLQPTLSDGGVIIRPLQPADWDEMFAAASDPLIWERHPVRDRYTLPVFQQFFDGGLASGSAFTIIDSASGAIIGSSRYHGYDSKLSEIEIGWTFLVRKHWDGKTNRAIKRLMLQHAFTFVETVVFWVGEKNGRSQRAMERIGGVRRAELCSRPPTGGAHIVFEITRQNFLTNSFWLDS